MTIEEKREKLRDFCNDHEGCDLCILQDLPFSCATGEDMTRDQIEVAYDRAFHDAVNHPAHYCREGAMESIGEMLLLFGVEAVKHFCVLNAWKYRYRAADKNGAEDLRKSDWYIAKYKELCEKENAKDASTAVADLEIRNP